MVSGNLYGTNLPLREPDQACESCGAQGTIGKAARFAQDGDILEMHRFCSACWPEQRARYRARWEEEDRLASERFFRDPTPGGRASPSVALEGASWHVALEVFDMVSRRMRPLKEPSPEELAAIARWFKELAAGIDEPMPLMMEAFVRQYGDAAT